MHAHLGGHKIAGAAVGAQAQVALDVGAVGAAHRGRDLLQVDVGTQVLDLEIGLQRHRFGLIFQQQQQQPQQPRQQKQRTRPPSLPNGSIECYRASIAIGIWFRTGKTKIKWKPKRKTDKTKRRREKRVDRPAVASLMAAVGRFPQGLPPFSLLFSISFSFLVSPIFHRSRTGNSVTFNNKDRERERERELVFFFLNIKKTTSQSRSGSWSMGLDGQCCFFFIYFYFFFAYWVYRVSFGFSGFPMQLVLQFYRRLLGFTGFYWV